MITATAADKRASVDVRRPSSESTGGGKGAALKRASIARLDAITRAVHLVAPSVERKQSITTQERSQHRSTVFRSAKFGFYIGAPMIGTGLHTVVEQ